MVGVEVIDLDTHKHGTRGRDLKTRGLQYEERMRGDEKDVATTIGTLRDQKREENKGEGFRDGKTNGTNIIANLNRTQKLRTKETVRGSKEMVRDVLKQEREWSKLGEGNGSKTSARALARALLEY
ncbi:hypothetical protein FS842_006605 [Serendipita sp. 407]|nr:hypothetical protein FS842_006605 [Serendipita sp. 407]